MNFSQYVESFQNLYLTAKAGPRANFTPSIPMLSPLSSIISFQPKRILILAPHPDDECLMSGFAIRAKEELQADVLVLPFSYGSNPERRSERHGELIRSLAVLGFHLFDPNRSTTLDELTKEDLLRLIAEAKPDVVITPHEKDGHPAHIRASILMQQALKEFAKTSDHTFYLLQSEFWQSMEKPNLVIPLSEKHLSVMGESLLKHQGEISRNPYHLTLPAWAMDQVRRGSEMMEVTRGLTQASAPSVGAISMNAVFAQIYRLIEINPFKSS